MRRKAIQFGLLLNLLVVSFATFSQAPTQFNFQGVARYSNGDVVVARPIALRFSIITGSADGPVSYQESRSTPTDSNGVFNAVIGGIGATSTDGILDTVSWAIGTRFLQVEIDTANGVDFINLGATQMLSVPYALYANSSGNYFFEAVFLSGTSFPDATETIVFPRTNYNQSNPITGNAIYDSTTGEFKAPVAGIYQFDVALREQSCDTCSEFEGFFLLVNGIRKRMLTKGNSDGLGGDRNYYQLHCTVYLKPGDAVSIQHAEDGSIESQSTFSGFKIK